MCPGSHIRRARGATHGRESPDVHVPDGPARVAEVGWLRGQATLGAAASRERCSVVTGTTKSFPREVLKANCGIGSAEPLGNGRRPVPAGKESDACTRRAPRRKGGGTERRIDVQSGEGLRPSQDPT